ncbi:MAG: dTMP kinase [Alphaproteobacteria bacterium]|nr:dTMP kinase [Alphaproteobacteria bacterium]
MKKGFFITLEGGDGCGKSTQCKMLLDFLKQNNINFIMTREPGGSEAAEEIRNIILSGNKEKWDSISETLLFSAARRSHLVDKIWPAIEQGKWVISDRFADSTMAYQGYGRGDGLLTKNDIETLYKLVAGDFKPDLTIILDMEPKEALQRVAQRGAKDRMEGMDLSFHYNLRNAFLDIAKKEPTRCAVINANQDPVNVHNDIIKVIQERLLKC